MLDKIVSGFLYLLHAKNKFQFAWKLVFLCTLVACISSLSRILVDFGNSTSSLTGILVDFFVSVPFFAIGIVIATRMLKLQDDLARLASTDLLTGLQNRRAFLNDIETAGHGRIILLDVDHFKNINDKYGHIIGDAVLVEIGAFLKEQVAEQGVTSRFGGEEFAIFLPDAEDRLVNALADRLVNGLKFENEAHKIDVTFSAGLSILEREMCIVDALRRADEALYDAKHAGRARFRTWCDKRSDSDYAMCS